MTALRSSALLGISAALLLVGCFSTPDPRITAVVDQVSADELRTSIEVLATEIGPRHYEDEEATFRTLEYVSLKLAALGLAVNEERTKRGDVTVRNIVATKSGTGPDPEFIEIGAHYDTVAGSPGADDNGSGVAAVLECARVLSEVELEKTIRFVLFGCEEYGLVGSRAHVAELQRSRQVDHFAGLYNLEMIGFASTDEDSQDAPVRIPFIASLPYTGDFVLVAGDWGSGHLGRWFLSAADDYADDLATYDAKRIAGFFSDSSRSDHSPYWEADLPAIMLTDTANFRNPHYHEASDTVDTIDFPFLARVTRAVVGTACEWAGMPEAPPEP